MERTRKSFLNEVKNQKNETSTYNPSNIWGMVNIFCKSGVLGVNWGPPILFQVRLLLGGWCYIIVHRNISSSFSCPSDLNPTCTLGILKLLCKGGLCGWVSTSPLVFQPSRHSGRRLQPCPCPFPIPKHFCSGDLRAYEGGSNATKGPLSPQLKSVHPKKELYWKALSLLGALYIEERNSLFARARESSQ